MNDTARKILERETERVQTSLDNTREVIERLEGDLQANRDHLAKLEAMMAELAEILA